MIVRLTPYALRLIEESERRHAAQAAAPTPPAEAPSTDKPVVPEFNATELLRILNE